MDSIVDDVIRYIKQIIYNVLPKSIGFNYITTYSYIDVVEIEISLIDSSVGFEPLTEIITFERDDMERLDAADMFGAIYNSVLHKIYRMIGELEAK